MKKEKVIGYKGFDKDFKCRGFQYKVGKKYTHNGEIKACESGFHFCKNPLDVLSFYKLNDSVFAEVEALGKVVDDENKSVTDCIEVTAQLDLPAFIKASVDFIWEKASKDGVKKGASATSGNYAHSATSGNYAHSATSGNRANSATSGYGAHSATSTTDSIACAIGRKSKAKASKGSWIVLAEWKEGEKWEEAKPINVISAQVDGKLIKADQWYKAIDGQFVETDDSNE